MRNAILALVLPAALAVGSPAVAENSTSVGGFTVHHNAFSTSTLTPEVAKSYGIQRSKYRGMLNISIIREQAGTTGRSVTGNVDTQIVTLTGQRSDIPMREVKEQDATYYLGEFPVRDQQTLNFVVTVTPAGSDEAIVVKMDQQFFTD